MDPQAEQDVLEASKNDSPKHHVDRWTRLISKWSPAILTKQKGHRRPAKRWEEDISSFPNPTKVHGDNNDLTNDTTWPSAAQDGLADSRQDPHSSRQRQPNQQQPDKQHERLKSTTTTTKATHYSSNPTTFRKLIILMTKATTNNKPTKTMNSSPATFFNP